MVVWHGRSRSSAFSGQLGQAKQARWIGSEGDSREVAGERENGQTGERANVDQVAKGMEAGCSSRIHDVPPPPSASVSRSVAILTQSLPTPPLS